MQPLPAAPSARRVQSTPAPEAATPTWSRSRAPKSHPRERLELRLQAERSQLRREVLGAASLPSVSRAAVAQPREVANPVLVIEPRPCIRHRRTPM